MNYETIKDLWNKFWNSFDWVGYIAWGVESLCGPQWLTLNIHDCNSTIITQKHRKNKAIRLKHKYYQTYLLYLNIIVKIDESFNRRNNNWNWKFISWGCTAYRNCWTTTSEWGCFFILTYYHRTFFGWIYQVNAGICRLRKIFVKIWNYISQTGITLLWK